MYYIGVDLGGTNIAVGLVNEKWEILHKASVKTNVADNDAMIKDMADLIKRVLNEKEVSLDEVKSVGVGIPGAIDAKAGVVIYSNNIKFANFPFVEKLKQYIDKDIYISNDANVAALGEVVAGAAKGFQSAVIITLGTGVGGGIVNDGKILEGYNGISCEIGHIVIEVDGEECTCGRKGCFEAYSSATALIRDTKRKIEECPDSLLAKISREDGKVTAKTVFDAYKLGDKSATEVVSKYIKYLAEGVANICNFLGPQVVLIGGGVSHEGDTLINPVREQVSKLTYGNKFMNHAEIKRALLGNDAGIIGAAALGK